MSRRLNRELRELTRDNVSPYRSHAGGLITSPNHMGFAVLGIAAAAAVLDDEHAARSLALTGATVEMV